MVDFGETDEIISSSMDYNKAEFLKAYYDNIILTAGEMIEVNPLAVSVFEQLTRKKILVTTDVIAISLQN